MALNVVTVRPTATGVVSCGAYRASIRSGSGALALRSMAPLHGGALTLQAGIGLTCKVAATGHRMVAVACSTAAGLQGGNAPLEPKKAAEQLKSVAERTLSMLRALPTPEDLPEGVRFSVALELGELRKECEGLVEELASGHVSDRTASITLLGFHARVRILLQLFRGSHGSLEEGTKKGLLTSYMEMNGFSLNQDRLSPLQPSGEELRNLEVAAAAAETSVPIFLKIVANKTFILLAKFSEFQLSKEGTVPERAQLALELKSLREMCDEHVADLAVGTLLGLHARLRIVFLFCTTGAGADQQYSRPDCLEERISSALAISMTHTEQSVNDYLKKEGKNEG